MTAIKYKQSDTPWIDPEQRLFSSPETGGLESVVFLQNGWMCRVVSYDVKEDREAIEDLFNVIGLDNSDGKRWENWTDDTNEIVLVMHPMDGDHIGFGTSLRGAILDANDHFDANDYDLEEFWVDAAHAASGEWEPPKDWKIREVHYAEHSYINDDGEAESLSEGITARTYLDLLRACEAVYGEGELQQCGMEEGKLAAYLDSANFQEWEKGDDKVVYWMYDYIGKED